MTINTETMDVEVWSLECLHATVNTIQHKW